MTVEARTGIIQLRKDGVHERTMAVANYLEPGKRGGRPCIRGMRITVYDVLSYLAAGVTVAEILDDFPYLTAEDILACLAYAAERERRMRVAVA